MGSKGLDVCDSVERNKGVLALLQDWKESGLP